VAYEDRNLTCAECNSEFVFSADDQQYHADHEYQDPKRCPSCRDARRAGGREFGRGSGPREIFETVCAGCGGTARVPFQPRQDRPVYCSDCFSKDKPTSPRR
jgi:CxxC-x17-CxxC domain-containing protein